MVRIGPAGDDDLGAMHSYLATRGDTCMFMRSNLAATGLRWQNAPLEGQYAIVRRDGEIAGVAAHYWNGMLLVQADAAIDELARFTVELTQRRVTGFTGALDQVRAVRAALGLASAPAQLDHDETLMALALDALVIPPPLARGDVAVRRAVATDRDTVVPWRAAYLVETSSELDPARAETTAATWFDTGLSGEVPWVATRDGAPVAICAFNARVPDTVQVGAVYTPPELRNRGHARAVVAAALLDARAHGVTRAILFTPRPDAVAAYRALGFETIGRFAVVLLAS